MVRRTSITKLQRQTGVAADLITLCQAITDDGRLSDEEISALRKWLGANRNAPLPAINFLAETVDRILADGKVTPEEQRELYAAIEAALPPDIRESVKGTRRSRDLAVKEVEHEARTAIARREAMLGHTALDQWDFVVAGVMFEGRAEIVRQHAIPGDVAYLIRDRANKFSKNAVEVRLANGMQAGFVPERLAAEISPLLDTRHKHRATIKKVLQGDWAPMPVIVASLFVAESNLVEAISEHQVPKKLSGAFSLADANTSTKSGCPLMGAVVLVVAAAIVIAIG